MINERERRLLTPTGFIEAVEEKLHKTQSFKVAYEQTEDEYESVFGKRKYSSYQSFKSYKSQKRRRRNRLI